MSKVFKRSLSFPGKISAPSKSHHIRSISLPCGFHPLISQLKEQINGLNAWHAKPESRTSAWLLDGLSRLDRAHISLADVLQLPHTQESLRRKPLWVEKLLEDFLQFVDVYGIFHTSILSLRQNHSAAHVAIRRRDQSDVAVYVKSRKSFDKEMKRLAAMVRCIGRDAATESEPDHIGDAELASVVNDVIEVTKMVSAALFSGVSGSSKKYRWMGRRLVNVNEWIQEFRRVDSEMVLGLREEDVKMVSNRMEDLESCIVGLEGASQRVFRGLVNARVSLLNSLTQ